jgi:methylphosphotriester-DNA--protein-cysteine methyltransferase
MRKLFTAAGVLILGFTGAAHADFVGNKDSKFFFPDTCSYVKLIKKDNVVNFKTSADAIAAGYKASSKCQSNDATAPAFVGNKSSKLFFPADCSVVKLIKDDNKVPFNTSADALAAGYKASSKCAQ